jgi:hypothetical protein
MMQAWADYLDKLRTNGNSEAKCLSDPVSSLRDEGVAGSNPVTPTIDLHEVFLP